MEYFPEIDEINYMLEDIANEIPKVFFQELNEGIALLPGYKLHPESRRSRPLYIMGEYSRSITGRNIKIYYGSFKKVYKGHSKEYIYNKLRDTLLHEFTHHLESLAGERGLEIKDARDLEKYRERKS